MRRSLAFLIPIVIISFILWPQLPLQDRPEYFDFADGNSLFNILNWQNVLSNLPFLFIGWFGLKKINQNPVQKNLDHAGTLFAIALFLTAFGSGYFHWEPNPQTLFWDRLPMALGFGSLISLITVDRLFNNLRGTAINLICLLSILTVVNWSYGNHDLRPYIALQFLGGSFLLIVSVCTRPLYLKNKTILISLGFYILAKVLETYDKPIFHMLTFTSGHALKHLSAAVSAYFILAPWINHPILQKPQGKLPD